MIHEKTDCEECVKQDVCGIKDIYKAAVDGVKNANTTTLKGNYHKAADNQIINVEVSCPRFLILNKHLTNYLTACSINV